MRLVICTVRDSAANVYGLPFTSHNGSTALRDFGHAVSDPDSQLNKSPECFALYYIGDFDNDTAEIFPCAPQLLANATQFVKE